MFKKLRIQNFKGWKDTGEIRMAPITLLFGANSSGKSSIGQFLMLLKQTVESADRKAVFYPGGKNSAVHLGSYREMVFHRGLQKKIGLEYQWSLPKKLKIEDPISRKTLTGEILSFYAEAGLEAKSDHAPILERLEYGMQEKGEIKLTVDMERKRGTRSEYTVTSENYDLVRNPGRAWPLGAPARFYGFPDEVVAYYQNADFVQILNLEHEKLFRSLHYLGPLRTKAERLYSWTGIAPESVGYAGEDTIAAILAARDRKINFRSKQRTKPFEETIAAKLKAMGLIEGFKVKPISKRRRDYEVKVRAKGSRSWVDLPDVGFGVSQVLPVLVQCFYAPPGAIIIMEQPEIHLHPSAQSALADVMIDVVNSREHGADRGIQLIIETHSEHFLKRLQRRIAEDSVPQEKVSAYFANTAKTPATLDGLDIDDCGNIRNWPERFFGDEMGDVIGHAEAALNKQMRGGLGKAEESK